MFKKFLFYIFSFDCLLLEIQAPFYDIGSQKKKYIKEGEMFVGKTFHHVPLEGLFKCFSVYTYIGAIN